MASSNSNYREDATKVVRVTNFSRRQRNEFVIADIKGNVDLELQARIYVSNKKHVSVYITKETDEEVLSDFRMTCLVSVLDIEHSERFTQSFGYIHQDKSEIFIVGLEKCFSRIMLLQNSGDLLPEDTLSLQFQLSYEGKYVLKAHRMLGFKLRTFADLLKSESTKLERKIVLRNISKMKPLTLFTFLRSIAGHLIVPNKNREPKLEETFDFETGRKSGKWTIIIETMEGFNQRLQFRRGIETLGSALYNASPVFHRILEAPSLERFTGKIKIDDFDAFTLGAFLKYVNTKKVQWPTDLTDIYSLYEMADKYAVLDLMTECSRHLAKHLNIENVMDIATLAVMHCDRYLKGSVAAFFNKKETLLIGKINIPRLHQLAKLVKLRVPINEQCMAFETIVNTKLTWKRVFVVKKFEDACILYEIAEEFQASDLMNESLRYMKQAITVENVPQILSLLRRCRNRNSLEFVVEFISQNEPYFSNVEQNNEIRLLFSETNSCSSSSSDSILELLDNEVTDDGFNFDIYR